jgi:hypothetical protein
MDASRARHWFDKHRGGKAVLSHPDSAAGTIIQPLYDLKDSGFFFDLPGRTTASLAV